MSQASEDTMRELDDILNASETYADRLAAFLQLKTAPKPQSNPAFVLGALDFSFDFDVDLVKLPPKPPEAAAKNAEPKAKEKPLQEITNESLVPPEPKATVVPQSNAVASTLPTQENEQPARIRSISSPQRSARRSIPTSDRLRRVAIHRRSRSCTRRDLLREFNNAVANSSSFLPVQSSTPSADKQLAAEPAMQAQQKEEKSPAQSETNIRTVPWQEHIESNREDTHTQSHHSILQSSLQRPATPESVAKRRTYTIEIGPEPGQLLLSPSSKNQVSSMNSVRQPNVHLRSSPSHSKLSADRLEIRSANTPPRVMSQSLSESGYIVHESPQPDLQQVVHNLSRNSSITGSPFVVVPISCLKAKSAVAQVEAAAPITTATKMINRSLQTNCSLRAVQERDSSAILTEDDSDEEQQHQVTLTSKKNNSQNSTQLLDLHYSRCKNMSKRSNRRTRQTVFNKPSRPAINGEDFALELARMSNYEILDLRKRQSQGRQHPLNGHRQRSTEEQLAAEEHKHLELEILRRNLDQSTARNSTPPHRISSAGTLSQSGNEFLSTTASVQSPAPPPLDFRDRSLQRGRSLRSHRDTFMQTFELDPMFVTSTAPPPSEFRDSLTQPQQRKKKPVQRRMRSRHREPPSSDEDQLLAVCTPPAQFRRSKSRRQSQLMETPEISLATPPSQFIDVPETDPEEELQQERIHNYYMEQLGNRKQTPTPEKVLIEEQPSRASRISMRLRTNSLQSRNRKQLSKNEQQETEQKLKREQQRKEEQEEQRVQQLQVEKHKKQQEEMLRKEKLLKQQEKTKQRQKEQEQEMLQKEQEALLQENQRLKEQQQQDEQQKKHEEQENMLQEERKQKRLQKKREAIFWKEQEEMLQKEQEQKEKLLQKEKQRAIQMQEDQQEIQQKEQEELMRKKEEKQLLKKQKKNKKQQKEQEQQQLDEMQQQQQLMEASNQELEQLPAPPSPPKDVFKKPKIPAPRAKRTAKSKTAAELTRLAINLRNETLEPDEHEATLDTTGVRRSRRGQVPLCNTWSHTVSDPFNFMCKNLAYFEMPTGYSYKPKKRSTVTSCNTIMKRPPLSSSTPRNAEWISEEPAAAVMDAPSAAPKKRGRKKNPPPEESAQQPAESYRKPVGKKKRK